MRSLGLLALALGFAGGCAAQDASQLESKGDAHGARAALEALVRSAPGDASALTPYAEFLDRRNDPAAREAYEKLLDALKSSGDRAKSAAVARRLVVLDLLAGDQSSAVRHLAAYRSAGGSGFADPPPVQPKASSTVETRPTIEIPGPIRSFARMAALSPDLSPEDILPALGRNVVTNGYQAASSNESLEQTEYLKLVVRYMSQARELAKIAGDTKVIKVETCDSTITGDLLRVLGYRMRGGCGAEVVLETVNASRAFLTIDSGFPLAELEQALRANRPFAYDYKPTQAPVLYGADYWLSAKEKASGEFIDNFLADHSLCRMYLGMSKLDRVTADALRKQVSVQRIKAFAHVLDFFGGMFQLTPDGRAVVPGGQKAEAVWADLIGEKPQNGASFFEKLIMKDDGWAASFFDSLSRVNGPVRDYLTEQNRLKRFYGAIRGRVTSPGPARPVFRSNTDMMLMTTRLRLEPDGKPHIPGNIEVWRNLFVHHPAGKYDSKLTKAAVNWKEADDVLEALFGLSRKAVENEPLKIFMALSDLNRRRAKPLDAATVDRLAREYRLHGSQYPLLNESGDLSDATIVSFLDTIKAITTVKDPGLRADTAGTMQALLGLWQIFLRQESLPAAQANATFAAIVTPFGKLKNTKELFDAGQGGVRLLLKATGAPEGVSPQDRFIDLLAGAAQVSDTETHNQMVQEMIRIFEAQRLISLKSILDIADHLEAIGKGEKLNPQLITRMSSRISEIQLPRAALSGVEKNAYAFGYWTEKHVEVQRKLNLRSVIEKAGADAAKLGDVRGSLAPFLRDTLVGLNYLHYAPPGAQILFTNPLFVRSHDFLGLQGSVQTWKNTEVFGTGWPSSAGGRLVGSLVGLPYALAEAEQNFLIPSREQALIWGDLVPQIIQTSKIPRWWTVTPNQMHWVALHLRLAESQVAEASMDAGVRKQVLDVLAQYTSPARTRIVGQFLAEGKVREALDNVTPSELFVLASATMSANNNADGVLADSIRRIGKEDPKRANYAEVSRAFGSPKPTLTNSYQPELLGLRTFPTLMGYSSRLMAESWESSLLYYAALADEMYMMPSQLNVLVPEWTRATVERIFATHLEDWPALLRSLRYVGDGVRQKNKKQGTVAGAAANF